MVIHAKNQNPKQTKITNKKAQNPNLKPTNQPTNKQQQNSTAELRR